VGAAVKSLKTQAQTPVVLKEPHPFDLRRHQISGDPIQLTEEVRTNPGGWHGRFSLSENGVLVFTDGKANHQLVLANQTGQKLQTVGSLGSYSGPRFSPDEKHIVVAQSDLQHQSPDIHVLDLARGINTRFTFDSAEDIAPIWSPDGSRIAWASMRNGQRDLYWKAANGAGAEELLWKSAYSKFTSDWSNDGRFILFQENTPQTNYDIWILPLNGERKAWPWLKTESSEYLPRLSPDDKWIAYTTNAPGHLEVFVRAFNPDAPAAGGQWQISPNGGRLPHWRRDGRELYYISADEKLMAVDITLGAEVKAGTPRALFDLRELRAVTANVSYAATGDGQRFLFVTSAEDATLTPFTVVTNWMAEVKK
jgi:Tol biopolymer transport system component